MRPHDVSGACGHTPSTAPSPCRRPSVGPARRKPRRRQSGSRPAGELFATPSAGYSSALFREPVPPWKCRHPAESSEGAGPENSSAISRRAVLQPRFRESAPRKTCVPENSDAVGPGNGSPLPRRAVPSGSASMSNSPPAVLGFSRTDQVPDSVTDIDRPAAGADPPRGHDARPARRFEQWRVQYSGSGEFGTPSCNAAGGTVNLIG